MAYTTIDIEEMLSACLPGGSHCDPQVIADAIRQYVSARPQAVDVDDAKKAANLAMLVARLVQQVRKHDDKNPVVEKAMAYLRRCDLAGSVIRSVEPHPVAVDVEALAKAIRQIISDAADRTHDATQWFQEDDFGEREIVGIVDRITAELRKAGL